MSGSHSKAMEEKTLQVKTVINGGDLYFISEEAVGAKWKSKSKSGDMLLVLINTFK